MNRGMTSAVQTHYRTCNICEAMCGLAIEHVDGKITSIRGDAEDPFSRGHICPKAVALQDYFVDPDRLKTPIERTSQGWVDISWEDALNKVAAQLHSVQAAHGNDAVAVYLGNPNAHNLGNALFLPTFFKALKSNNRYSSASADQLPHHVASNYMFGAGMLIPVPDIDRTDFLLIVGGNPAVSNGSMMTAPGVSGRIRNVRKRGGKVVVIDPRRTETARLADEHLFIRPERDALLLLALIHTVFTSNQVELGHLGPIVDGLDDVRVAVSAFPPERVATEIGIAPEKIRQLALDMAAAPSAVCYARMGACTQSFGGLCQWLNNVLNIVTNNCDRPGGAMFPEPALDLLARSKRGKPTSYGRYRSRVRGLPFYNGEFPVSTMAEEIMTPGEGQIKALVTIAGNPVLSSPGGSTLAEAFKQLEYMVSVDIYLNETTKHANIILPSTTGLEVGHYDIFFNSFSVSNNAKYSPPLFQKTDAQRHDWQIIKALAARLSGVPEDEQTPETLLDLGLRSGAYGAQGLSLDRLLENPHGIHLGPLRSCLKARLMTADGRITLAPQVYLDDLPRLETLLKTSPNADRPFQLISRRLLRSHNTWTQNSRRLVKGKNPCTVQINPEDASRLGIEQGDWVCVRSDTGQIEIEAQVDQDLMPGV